MFRHAVMFKFSPTTTSGDVAHLTDGLGALPAAIPEIRSYRFGPDAGINEGTFDFAVVADFDSADDYLVYRDHPAHRELIAERIAPFVSERAALQYEC